MGEINVHITVINTHIFLFFIQYLFIYFKLVKDGTHSFVKLLSQYHKHIFVLLFLFYGVHEPFWFVILHINIQHTKLLGGMCDTVKI